MFGSYWDDYQAAHDPMWLDADEQAQKDADDEAYYDYVDQLVDEKLLERKG